MSMPEILTVIQARMSSSRLPGKVLQEIAGRPMLGWVVERARRSKGAGQVVVATTVEKDDDAIAAYCESKGISCFRGSLHDVLDRFYQAARTCLIHPGEAVVVRLTADCPLIDPDLIDQTTAGLFGYPEWESLQEAADSDLPGASPAYDFAANRLPPPWGRTFPIGLDVEACTFMALEQAWREAGSPYQREHVMPYLYEDSEVIDSLSGQVIDGPKQVFANRHPFRVLLVNHPVDYGELRWTVDTPQDLELVRQIFARFHGREDFTWQEVLSVVQSNPQLAGINTGVEHKTAFDVDGRA